MFAFTPLLLLAAIGLANASPQYSYSRPTYSPPGYRPPGYTPPGFPTTTSSSSSAAPTSTGSACTSYTIIDTRGTGEAQGESRGFTTMNQRIMQQVTGGSRYDTVYPAGYNQDSSQATTDVSLSCSAPLSHVSAYRC